MPPLAIAGLAAVATVGGAVIGAKAQKKAANQAADSQLQVANQNNALVRELYGQNTANFTPYMQSGARANSLLDSFIYGSQAPPAAPMQQPAYSTPGIGDGIPGNPAAHDLGIGSSVGGMTAFSPRGVRNLSLLQGQQQPANLPPQPTLGQAPAPGAVTTPAPNAMSGYEQFQASPYYQHPLQEGMRQLNHGLASSGKLESGDAIKRALRYGQDYGAGRMDEYLNLVRGQQQTGYGAASALAGVGQNTTAMMMGNNQNAADALSNAALLRGQANNNMWGGIGGALGTVLGSSYRPGG